MSDLLKWPLNLFSILAKYDYMESVLWNPELTKFSVICSDFFFHACADAEEIKDEDLPEFERALQSSDAYGDLLWCARKRKMQPINRVFENFNKAGLLKEIDLFRSVNKI
jgi:hypothetical protein